jgi:hypothetical protein
VPAAAGRRRFFQFLFVFAVRIAKKQRFADSDAINTALVLLSVED